MVGQQQLATSLLNAIGGGRLGQAYLFCGPRGVGKTSCARIFARTINCTNRGADGEACGECESCRDFDSGNSYNVIELDAASNNGVENIRTLTEQVNVPPQIGSYRVFIIDEVHMLSTAAFNAFLKTLEEPPRYAVFILATTEKNKVLPTILSRCQIFDFKRIGTADIVSHLRSVAGQEGIACEDAALDVIARKSDGAMRDALSIFDQLAAATSGNIDYASAIGNLNVLDYEYYFRFADAFSHGDVNASLLLFNEVVGKGFDPHFFINGLASHLRDLMLSLSGDTAVMLDSAPGLAARYAEQAALFSSGWYYKALELLSRCDLEYRESSSKRLLVELALIHICGIGRPGKDEQPAASSAAPAVQPAAAPAAKPAQPAQAAPAAPHPTPAAAPKPEPETASKPAHAAPVQPSPITHSSRPSVNIPPVPASQHPARKAMRSTGSLSLKTGKGESAAEKHEEKPKAESRDKAYTDEEFAEAWRAYISANPTQRIMVNAMRGNLPERTAQDTYTLTVANPAQKSEFENNLGHLAGFLRDRLGNDNVTIRVGMQAVSEDEKPRSREQLLKDWVKRNPALGDLIKSLDAEMV